MLKLLLLALAVWLLVLLLRAYRRSLGAPSAAAPQQEDMVRCEACGVYLPRSASILRHGRHYCCEQHSERTGQ